MLDPSLSREELVEQIDRLLTTLREDLDAGIVSVDMFSIFKVGFRRYFIESD